MVKSPSLKSLTRKKEVTPLIKEKDKKENNDVKITSVRIPKSMWKDLKYRTIDEERSMHSIILSAIGEYINKN